MIDNKQYNLFLDDDPSRIPNDLPWIKLPLVNWTVVRNYNEFVKIIEERGLPEIVSFDHDLGDTSYKEFFRAVNSNKVINYNNIEEKTGRDCAKFLVEFCVNNKLQLPIYYVHSLNGIGVSNIISVMESGRKVISSNEN